jgi:hypothetical protein
MFPLAARPEGARVAGGLALIVANALLLAALVVATGLYGLAELRWTTVVVVSGLVFLFAPALFQVWPERWRDGRAGLVALVGAQALALALLGLLHGGPPQA